MDLKWYESRQYKEYYSVVRDTVRLIQQKEHIESSLDVGPADVPLVKEFGIPECVVLEPQFPRLFDGCEWLRGDLCSYDFGRAFDLVLCLQCLEHIADIDAACANLRRVARKFLVVSLPWQWGKGWEKGHIHDPVTMEWIIRHLGPPTSHVLCDQLPTRHIVCVYDRR
jgi:SAM-dependent methyltransferase